ncbi:hypothetical protein MRB53_014153 [Persea americana]|uniref:Uncharacterized protein n=1 Tax=Persea americana TaxID=3435 RepID=A0ACC2KA41_PERAE|nr:hypothetical protein MRB53_014153 [Persea americana]
MRHLLLLSLFLSVIILGLSQLHRIRLLRLVSFDQSYGSALFWFLFLWINDMASYSVPCLISWHLLHPSCDLRFCSSSNSNRMTCLHGLDSETFTDSHMWIFTRTAALCTVSAELEYIDQTEEEEDDYT